MLAVLILLSGAATLLMAAAMFDPRLAFAWVGVVLLVVGVALGVDRAPER